MYVSILFTAWCGIQDQSLYVNYDQFYGMCLSKVVEQFGAILQDVAFFVVKCICTTSFSGQSLHVSLPHFAAAKE
jgi:hypothetical protein